MKSTKIVIKCDGLSVHTKDLGMGLSILNRLKEHGIMNHVEVPIKLLEKASEFIKELCDKLEEYLPKWGSNIVEEPHVFIRSGILNDEQKKKSDDIEKTLIDAIDIDALVKAFKVKASDIKVKAVIDEATDEIPIDEEAENIMDKIVNRSNERQHQWTKEEVNILKNNFSVSDKELDRLIPTRTLEAIRFKRRVLLGKIRHKKTSSKKFIRWSNKELKALEVNMHLKPRQLQKLPWLKRRTLDQINQKKHKIKKDIIARKAEESYED